MVIDYDGPYHVSRRLYRDVRKPATPKDIAGFQNGSGVVR
jgi:hypothetical protein